MPYWLQFTIFAIIAGLVQYIITYFKEKGKNLATKEDIGEITKEIKSVESQFINETEKLKNKLAILANAQTDITSMERQAIIEVNKSLFMWIDSVLNIPNVNNSIQINNYINAQNQLYKNVQQDEIVLRLFVKSDNIHNILHKIILAFLKIQTEKQLKCHEIIKINNEIDDIKPETPSKEKREKLQRKIEERKTALENISEKVLEEYTTIAPMINEFREKSKEQIYKILKPEH